MPRPVSFVVKKGSNTCGTKSGSMPAPVSATRRNAYTEDPRRSIPVEIDRRPPCGIASRAFTQRLSSDWLSSVGSAETGHGSSARTVTSSRFEPSTRRSIRCVDETTSFRSTVSRVRASLRLNESRRWVRSRARSAATPI